MAESFNCPTCGAPLDYDGSGETMRCPYCHNSVIVPEELRAGTPAMHVPSLGGPADQAPQQPGQLMEVMLLMQAGKEIEAIKLYRQMTGCGLAEAKTAVEAIQAGNPVPASPAITPGNGSLPPERVAEIKRLVQSNQKIEAIKIYRQITGSGLKEAKDEVEWISSGVRPQQAKKSAGSKIISVLCGLGLLGIASIFPLVFIPMGISSLQAEDVGGAIGSFIGAGIWALVWGGIGLILIFFV